MSFTPCVYPLIPVTAGYIGIQAKGSKLKGLIYSFIYITGIAITYSFLGLLVCLTGTIFGKISSHPLTFILVGSIIIVFGLSMLNIFAINFPIILRPPRYAQGPQDEQLTYRKNSLTAQLSHLKKKTWLSILLLGLTSGLIVSPCVVPALGAILFFITTTKNIVCGITLLMTFAYGMGLILILVGTFSTIMLNLPKSGKWLVYVERICAIIIIGVGIYFIYNGIMRI